MGGNPPPFFFPPPLYARCMRIVAFQLWNIAFSCRRLPSAFDASVISTRWKPVECSLTCRKLHSFPPQPTRGRDEYDQHPDRPGHEHDHDLWIRKTLRGWHEGCAHIAGRGPQAEPPFYLYP